MLDDETIKKVQSAFDAYIFLSYRKKDRIFAQELMRLIHKNDFCRDIAIWYDEFLTPGEDFNKTIRDALEKSGLFVLAVTPSLLEPRVDENGVEHPNYIEKEEYPMAVDSGKPILPAEMVETDKDELARKYADIPSCTDAHDDKKLSNALLEIIEKIAKRENDKNPEHNFFIGLAYLNGIDVEVDHEKARMLITFAAENNVPEAMDKLIEMYNSGFGVERDFYKAIQWHEKKIEYFQKIYDENPTPEIFDELFWVITCCGDAYRDIAELENAKKKYNLGLGVCEQYVGINGLGNLVKRNISVSLNKLGNIYVSLGDINTAKEYYAKSLEIRKTLAEETGSTVAWHDLASSYYKMSFVVPNEAKEYLTDALKIMNMLCENCPNVEIYHQHRDIIQRALDTI